MSVKIGCFNVECDVLYEVIVTTKNSDMSYNSKPFGITFDSEGLIHMRLFENRTLSNILDNGFIRIQFMGNIYTITRALLGELDKEDYVDDSASLCGASFVFDVDVISIDGVEISDVYSTTHVSNIVCRICDVVYEGNDLPVLSRATYKILDFLVVYSRVNFMNFDEINSFYKKIVSSNNFIKKCGNHLHEDALKLIEYSVKNILDQKKEED